MSEDITLGARTNRRLAERRRTALTAVVSNPTYGSYRATVRNISDTGLYLDLATYPLPPIGTELHIETTPGAGQPHLRSVTAVVVRQDKTGVGLRFTGPETLAQQ